MAGYASRLKKIQGDYKKAERGFGDSPPEGIYQAKVSKAQLVENKSQHKDMKGKLQVKFQFTILHGDYAKRKIFTDMMVEGAFAERGLPNLKGVLYQMGIEMDNISDLLGDNGALAESLGKVIEVRVKNNPKNERFPYVNVNGLVEEVDDDDEIEDADDEAPFDEQDDEIDIDEDDLEEGDEDDEDDEEEEEEEEEEEPKPKKRAKKAKKAAKPAKKKAKEKKKSKKKPTDDEWDLGELEVEDAD